MKKMMTVLAAAGFLGQAGCLFTSDDLPGGDEQVVAMVQRLANGQDQSDNVLAPDLEQLAALMADSYQDDYQPTSFPEVGLLRQFYLGMDVGSSLQNASTAGAFAARPMLVPYEKVVALAINGPWAEPNNHNYRSYTRTITQGDAAAFLAGTLDELRAHNEAINTAEQGLVFQFTSESKFRRVRGLKTPQGEAYLHWELMNGPATRLEGGLSGYLNFLFNMQFVIPVDAEHCWRGSASWAEAGGSFLFFSGTATSGNIGNGIRNDLDDLAAYLVSH